MKKVQDKVMALLQSTQLGIFANGYWGHPAMKLSPEVNLLALTHYFQALEFQRKANQVVAILGAKTPHIQNLAVGGVMNAINFDSLATLNLDRLVHDQVALRRDRAVRPAGLLRGCLRDRRLLPGVVRVSARA